MNVYTSLLVLVAVCCAFADDCPPNSGEDTFTYHDFKNVKGTAELELKNAPPVIAVRVDGGKAKVAAEVGGKRVEMGEGKGNIRFAKATHTNKLFFTPEGTDSIEVTVSVCYSFD